MNESILDFDFSDAVFDDDHHSGSDEEDANPSAMANALMVCNVLTNLGCSRQVIDAVAKECSIPSDTEGLDLAIGLLTAYKSYSKEGKYTFDHENPLYFSKLDQAATTFITPIGAEKVLRRVMGAHPVHYGLDFISVRGLTVHLNKRGHPISLSGVPPGVNLKIAYETIGESENIMTFLDARLANACFTPAMAQTLSKVFAPVIQEAGVIFKNIFQDLSTKRLAVEVELTNLALKRKTGKNQNFAGDNYNPIQKGFSQNCAIHKEQIMKDIEAFVTLGKRPEYMQAIKSYVTAFRRVSGDLALLNTPDYVAFAVQNPDLNLSLPALTVVRGDQHNCRSGQPDASKTYANSLNPIGSAANKQAQSLRLIHSETGRVEFDCHGSGELGLAAFPFSDEITLHLYDKKAKASAGINCVDLLNDFTPRSTAAISDVLVAEDQVKAFFLKYDIPTIERKTNKKGEDVEVPTTHSNFSRTLAPALPIMSKYDVGAFKFHVGNPGRENTLPKFYEAALRAMCKKHTLHITRYAQRTSNLEVYIAYTPSAEDCSIAHLNAVFEQVAFFAVYAGESRRINEILTKPPPSDTFYLHNKWIVLSGSNVSVRDMDPHNPVYVEKIPEKVDISAFQRDKPFKNEGPAAPRASIAHAYVKIGNSAIGRGRGVIIPKKDKAPVVGLKTPEAPKNNAGPSGRGKNMINF